MGRHVRHTEDPLLVGLLKSFSEESSEDIFNPYVIRNMSLSAETFGRPNLNPPSQVEQDNLILYSFTLDTDKIFFKFAIPFDIHIGDGSVGISMALRWTNDGGVDDDGKNVLWRFDYQLGKSGTPISGSYVNSPKYVGDTYDGASGWLEHQTDFIVIPDSEFVGQECIFVKVSAITPTAPALTCEPHLIGACMKYMASRLA